VPHIDTVDFFRTTTAQDVLIAIRGVAEMESENSRSQVWLTQQSDEFGIPRAFFTIAPTGRELAMWDALDSTSDQVARVLSSGHAPDVVTRNRDGLGTTYHELGTLRMGDDAKARCQRSGKTSQDRSGENQPLR
jgi:hypothetical protein